jgi:RNA polymerase sigma-70 factor (ECF subfamily)
MTSQQEQAATRLMSLAQQGDSAAYTELLTMLSRVARQFARSRAGDVPWLDDVAQETLLTVHRVRHTYDIARPFAPWFYAILSSRLIDVIRRERRVGARELGMDVLPERAEPPTGSREESVRVVAAVGKLPARQREIVHRLKIREESVKSVSRRLGMSESAVKVAAHRGYRTLRRLLGGSRDEH